LDRIKHLIVLFVLIISTQFTSAQQNISVDETIFIHANATTFVSGETLLYKIYCLKSTDKTPSNISKVAYVELIDNNKKPVFKTKISLENSVGQGDYFIATTLKTGNYKLIGYTNWMLNKPVSELFQLDINIINPYIATEKGTSENTLTSNTLISKSTSAVPSTQTNITDENVKLNLNKKTFTNRELVNLKIESLNTLFAEGNYSLSVRKLDNIPTTSQISASGFAVKTTNSILIDLKNKNQKVILPELRGENITGKIISQNGTDKIEDISIGLSLPGKSFVFKIVKTDAQGNFIFNISKTYYTSDIIIQIIDEKAINYNLVINNAPEIDYANLSFEQNSNLSYTTKESLLDRSIASQVENAYYHKKVDNIVKNQTLETFYFPLAKEYVLDDYTRFKTLKETITEVATEVYQKQKEDKLYLHVNDPSVFPQLPDPALVLVDGLYLENQNELAKYNMKGVYKIDVIVGRYYVGSKSFNGLVSFTTFDKDFKSSQSGTSIAKPTILRPQPKKLYNKIDYNNVTDNARIPDFRNQLFWNPDAKLNSESNNTFYTSDLSGTFEIRLEGFAKNGAPVSLKEIIEVKDSSAN
jgi:23S rRNA U2552 (ribose-2'-O)-methylase RlmE/FtsJ